MGSPTSTRQLNLKDKFNIIESLDINDPSFSNKNPMVSPDGKHLYFSSNRPWWFWYV